MSNDRLKFRARFKNLATGKDCWQHLALCRVQTFQDQLPGAGWLQVTDWEQWTGLYDSEGVEIYEGDVIKKYSDCNTDFHGDYCLYEVTFNNGGFILSYLESEAGQKLPKGYTAGFMVDQTEADVKLMLWSKEPITVGEFTVVGNIYDA